MSLNWQLGVIFALVFMVIALVVMRKRSSPKPGPGSK